MKWDHKQCFACNKSNKTLLIQLSISDSWTLKLDFYQLSFKCMELQFSTCLFVSQKLEFSCADITHIKDWYAQSGAMWMRSGYFLGVLCPADKYRDKDCESRDMFLHIPYQTSTSAGRDHCSNRPSLPGEIEGSFMILWWCVLSKKEFNRKTTPM